MGVRHGRGSIPGQPWLASAGLTGMYHHGRIEPSAKVYDLGHDTPTPIARHLQTENAFSWPGHSGARWLSDDLGPATLALCGVYADILLSDNAALLLPTHCQVGRRTTAGVSYNVAGGAKILSAAKSAASAAKLYHLVRARPRQRAVLSAVPRGDICSAASLGSIWV